MVVRVYVCWLGDGCCLVASMNHYLVGWLVGVLHVRACVWFGFTMWQATELMVETMAVMQGFWMTSGTAARARTLQVVAIVVG